MNLIVARSPSGVIGRAGKLPWNIPEDLARFRELTMGHFLVMGRRTYESVGWLDGRGIIVLTRNPYYRPICAIAISSLSFIPELYEQQEMYSWNKIFIAGGASVYEAALATGMVEKLYITEVHDEYEGDTYFHYSPRDEFDFVESSTSRCGRCEFQEWSRKPIRKETSP